MHKKSLEAAKKMQEEDETEALIEGTGKDSDDLRSESIAALRAKAQEHSARMMEALNREGAKGFDDSSNSSINSSFLSDSGDMPGDINRH